MWFRAISARKSYTETFTKDEESADRTTIIKQVTTDEGGDNTRTLKGFLERYKDLVQCQSESLDEGTVDSYSEGDEDFKTALNEKLHFEGVTKSDAAVSVLTDRLLELTDHRLEQALVRVLKIKDRKLSQNMLVLITEKLLKCGADPNGTTDMTGSSPLNIAVSKRNVKVVEFLLSKKARTDVKDRYGYTPLMNAVDTGSKEIVELLIKNRANRLEKTADQKTLLHLAAGAGDEDLVDYFIKKGLSVADEDKNGWTPLHEAAFFGFQEPARILLENGIHVDVTDHKRQTPLHIAAQEGNVEVVELLCKNQARLVLRDKDGNTPMDLWANRRREIKEEENIIKRTNTEDDEKDAEEDVDGEDDETEEDMGGDEEDDEVDKGDGDHEAEEERSAPLDTESEKMLNVFKIYCVEQDEDQRLQIDKVMNKTPKKKTDTFTKDDVVAGYLRSMTPFGVVEMMKQCRNVGKKGYSFLHDFVEEGGPKMTMKESTKAVMDKFVLGQSLVWCEIMEEDGKGHCPDQDGKFQAKDSSLLDVIVELDRKDLVQHPAMMALVDKKWNRTAKWLFTRSFIWFLVRMAIFAAALIIAARPDLDNPGCYRNSLDYFRLVLEVISLICFIMKGYDEIVEMAEYKKNYFLDYFNYLQLLGIALALMIIPFRAATTWCASTGVGYCALPVGNVTDISHHCITASQIQWIFASLAYLANCLLLLEYLSLFRMTGIYVRIIVEIIKSDIVKFTVLYSIFLLVFVGSFYFGLRAGVTVKDDGQLVSDVSVFPLEALYPWHVLFTGIRILLESGSVVDYFSSDDTTGEYIGYQWFSVVLYLLFLFIVIIVLLNILIAQMSDSYSKAHEDVEGTFAMARARIVARLLKGSPLWHIPERYVKWRLEKKKKIPWFLKSFKALNYQKYIWIDSPEDIFSNEKKSMEMDARLERLDQKVDTLTKMISNLTEKFPELQDDDKNKDSEGEQTDGGEITDDEDGGVSRVEVIYDEDRQPKTNL